MNKLKVTITAGGTQEYIDDVRVLTNISTGRLGSKIADTFISHGHDVIYVAPKDAVMPASHNNGMYEFRPIKDTNSVLNVMKEVVPQSQVVIHSMAVSDFTFDLKGGAIKVSSDNAEALIAHMRNTIVKTPKVISYFRDWNPDAVLVGFKFTSGETPKELAAIAIKLMETNHLDMVFANDKLLMKNALEHVGSLIMREWSETLSGKDAIAESMYTNVMRIGRSNTRGGIQIC